MNDASDPASPAQDAPGDAAGRGRLLIVDDEEVFAGSLQRLLSNEHDVTVVTSGRAALEQLCADEARGIPETKPIALGTKPIAPETEPIALGTKPIAPETEPVAPETEPIAPGTKPVAPGNKPVAFDAIVCDLMMPGTSGLDLHTELRRRAPELAERIIFLTGGAVSRRAQQFLETIGRLGSGHWFEKPCNLQELRAAIRQQIARSRGM